MASDPMTPLDWDKFTALPGSPRDNFELLCRGAVTHAYARYGRFIALAQQPGVEFHLDIDQPGCPLGDSGRCFGWQTKWWDLAPGRAIGVGRRRDVKDSLEKTEKHFPEITDFVLWTRHPLTAGDQTWFYGLPTQMKLHLATEVELGHLLIGDAVLLRGSYFGSLVLTPERLAEQHARAAAEAGERWIPEVHQASAAEHRLRRMLAEPDAWDDLGDTDRNIARFAAALDDAATTLPAPLADATAAIVATGRDVAELLHEAHQQIRSSQPSPLLGATDRTVPQAPAAQPAVLRRLRALRHAAALPLTNLIAHVREAAALAHDVTDQMSTRLAVVTGDAGYGKTQLSATLTAPTEARPAGVLLYSRRLSARQTLDDLASQVTAAGKPLASFEELLAAVDAAAQRAGCRLPIVIDGLNEAETPTLWPALLRSLQVTLKQYPSVLVVCTVREAFLDDTIPTDVKNIFQLDGFDEDLDEAIARYFTHYKIEPGGADLPRELLSHPLTLKIYCTVANRDRRQPVSAAGLPSSLTGIFSEYLTAAAQRVYDLIPSIHPNDVNQALDALGNALWEDRARDLPDTRARQLCQDTHRRWQESLLAALEHEGVLLRHPDGAAGATWSFVYDLMAGHVIATSLARAHGRGIAQLLSEDTTTALFNGKPDERHPLAADIFQALAGVMPRVGATQLWQAVAEPLRLRALLHAARLEAAHLDSATVEALVTHIDDLRGRNDILQRLHSTRAAPGHPLNAHFLDRILRDRPVAGRDLRWSEWQRAHSRFLLADATALALRWREHPHRAESDRLRARWLMWTLTSTVRDLRDAATAALYWYGRHDASGLFALALEAITVNDAYVGERMVAACYGVATAHPLHAPDVEAALSAYLAGLLNAFTGPEATHPTFHALTRYYVSSTFEFAHLRYPAAVPVAAERPLTFTAAPVITPLPEDDPRWEGISRTMGMDFGNYTLGRLFPDRSNYDDSHSGHQEATAVVLGVVYALGWRPDLFDEVEARITSAASRQRHNPAGRVERYGKKYGWIGFHIMAGMLADRGQPPEDLEVDIDPTFPQPPQLVPVLLGTWAPRTPADDLEWLRHGIVKVPDDFLAPARLDEDEGPWLLVHAEIDTEDVTTGRDTFGLFNTVLVDQENLTELLEAFDAMAHPGRNMIDLPAEYYVFAGEIPWHARFAAPEPGLTIQDLYSDTLRYDRPELRFERLAHHFTWESHHSSQNQATAYVPSRLFSQAFDLRALPAGFDQSEPSGARAARSFAAPPGFSGSLLYLRADLLRQYAAGRAIVTFCWGERQIKTAWPERPSDALKKLYQAYQNIWRQTKQH
ncbi:NACHT domain-containing protein [Streptomyces sp. NPDC058398]|uniref:NACHT domain-containing protein n=1 Tax=Streptomyces sp. NPDC058398 TaxID=3346479 RepID=UPI003660911A